MQKTVEALIAAAVRTVKQDFVGELETLKEIIESKSIE